MFRLVENLSPERRRLVFFAAILSGLGSIVMISALVDAVGNLGGIGEVASRLRTPALIGFFGFSLSIAGLAAAAMGLELSEGLRDLGRRLLKFEGGASRTDCFIAATSADGALVQIRCRFCLALNDEQAKCCDQCGTPM
jgi:hypothetical protein